MEDLKSYFVFKYFEKMKVQFNVFANLFFFNSTSLNYIF